MKNKSLNFCVSGDLEDFDGDGDWDFELELRDEIRDMEQEHSERKDIEVNLGDLFEKEF